MSSNGCAKHCWPGRRLKWHSLAKVAVHELSRVEARRIAVRAQMLDRNRPAGLLDLVRQLTLLQVDLTAAVAPSADLIVWSRLGSSYSPSELEVALANQTLIELGGMIRPGADLALYRADMRDWPGRGELREWEEEHPAQLVSHSPVVPRCCPRLIA